MTAPVISIVVGPAELAEAAASWTAERITGAVAARRACYLALAGGETPRGCYQRLAGPPYRDILPWASVFVYWSDERQVPLDDPASNYAMAKAALLDHVPIPPEQVFPLVGDPTPALRRVPPNAAGSYSGSWPSSWRRAAAASPRPPTRASRSPRPCG